ncbi:MAG: hypothetical protein LVO36_01230 [Nitrosopumilus sp. (ex Thoosa mismalolli)]|nr:hypothetical protein [Nitrosopumilus sp. (ex Thoosa mismalolli)]
MFSKKKITLAYTIEKCPKCETIKKRKFSEGDILFTESTSCSSCDGIMLIEKIYGETLEQ